MSVTVDILVQPRASRAKIGPMHDGRIKIAVTAPPVDGEANAAVIELLARQLGIARGEAQEYIKRYFERYPGVQAFMQATREQAHRDSYVETLFGRRLYLNEIHSRNQGLRAGAERAAINAPMQGTAADIIKRAMIAVDAWLQTLGDPARGDAARMIMQVHDELVFEVREERLAEIERGVRERMMQAAELAVPLVVDIGVGANWDEAH